jgi:hypothetical protein
MSVKPERTTVYLNPDLHKALRLKSIASSKSISDLINEAVRELLKKEKRKYHTIMEIMSEPKIEVKTKFIR